MKKVLGKVVIIVALVLLTIVNILDYLYCKIKEQLPKLSNIFAGDGIAIGLFIAMVMFFIIVLVAVIK